MIWHRLALAVALMGIGLILPAPASAQPEGPRSDPRMRLFAAATLDVAAIHEETEVLLSSPQNKTVERQAGIRAEASARIARAIEGRGLTRAEYDRLQYLVTTDPEWRAAFDRWIEQARDARKKP